MRIDRFYIPESIAGDTIEITEDRLLHQWNNVLRAKSGFEMMLFDGSGFEYDATIQDIRSDGATLSVGHAHAVQPITPAVWLYVGLIKRDKFEWLLEKATEIGVTGIVPLDCERSQKKDLKYDRARKIIIEAAEQSGRAWLPEIGEIKTVDKALEGVDPATTGVLDADGEHTAEELRHGYPAALSAFIGPEGGWSNNEREQFAAREVRRYSLGQQNLKTETAAVAVSSLTLLK